MAVAWTSDPAQEVLPDHKQLPDHDGAIVQIFQEHPQSTLLTGLLSPLLQQRHPDGQYCIGCDNGIYWKHTKQPFDGCKAPDWFYVPGVPPMLDGEMRRSYVLWKEGVAPLLVIEYVSGDGSEERDTTPGKGKFWVYEQGIRAPYYLIFEAGKPAVELYELDAGCYARVQPNAAGRVLVRPLGIELGIWEGPFQGQQLPWLRAWDSTTGTMLPSTEERERSYKHRAESAEGLLDDLRESLQKECERAEAERKRAEALAARLRGLGLDPDAV